MAIASISTVALSMAILGTFVLLMLGSHNFVEKKLRQFEIRAFAPRGASQADAEKLRDSISKLKLATNVKLLSRNKEWAAFKRSRNLEVVSGVVGNPLPYAIDVQSKDPRRTAELANQIRKLEGVGAVKNAQESYGYVKAIADLVKLLGFAASLILCFTTIFIISNAIRLTLFARRHEIRIMQLVGATNGFIRIPLVLEGIVLGIIGTLIAVGLIAGGSEYVASMVQRNLPPTLFDLSSDINRSQFNTSLIIAGGIIGALGSVLSIRRFLKI